MDKVTENKVYHLIKMTKQSRSLENDKQKRHNLKQEIRVLNRILELGINTMIDERQSEILKSIGEEKLRQNSEEI